MEEELSEVRSGANVASLPQEGISEPQAQGGFNRKSVFKSDSRCIYSDNTILLIIEPSIFLIFLS